MFVLNQVKLTKRLVSTRMQINLDKNNKYLLACSFGPDSMALFSLLINGGYYFEVAHINYGMRGEESNGETTKLQAYCLQKGVICHVFFMEGKKVKGNFQKQAREYRYEKFREIINEREYTLLTGHHKDDLIETYLMQINSNRKTFYYGIAPLTTIKGMEVERPLLDFTKEELLVYVRENNIPFGIDSSNSSSHYTRNKLRHEQVEKLTNKEKDALIDQINCENQKQEKLLFKIKHIYNKTKITINDFNSLSEEEKDALIYYIFTLNNIPDIYSKNISNNVIALINKSNTSAIVEIYKPIFFVKFEEGFTFIDISTYQAYSMAVETPKRLNNDVFSVDFSAKNVVPQIDIKEYPLTIVSLKSSIVENNKQLNKKVARMLINMKMPRHYRLIWPIVLNNKMELVYVPRYRRDYLKKASDLFTINL